MPLEFLLCALVVFASSLGLGWPLAARLHLDPAAQLLAAFLLSLLGVWLIAWSVYVFALPSSTLWAIPALTAVNLTLARRSLIELLRDPTVRALVFSQLLVSSWCAGWLALIVSYSGGDWVGDWFGHWDRTIFFLARGPHDILFTGFDPLPSRPPLVNVIVGAWLRVTRFDFAHYQLVLSLLNSLAFLPAALLARRFGGGDRAIALLAVLVMLNPLFVQNATYAWTKLITAAFALTGLYFFLRAHDSPSPRAAGLLAALALGGGMLAHYSGAVPALILALLWIILALRRRSQSRAAAWRHTVAAGLAGALLLATWFGWALAIYGPAGTFLSNTSVTDVAATRLEQLMRIVLNLRDTVVPFFLRDVEPLAQRSLWGAWRDAWFQLAQRNAIFAAGCVGGLLVLWRLGARARTTPHAVAWVWTGALAAMFVIGIAAHAGRDPWGNSHICLQPLVLLALACLAADWGVLLPGWRRVAIIGLILDALLGIVLHFGVQSHLLDRWLTPARLPADYFTSYTEFALMNLRAKHQLNLTFLSDALTVAPALILALLAAVLALALRRAAGAGRRAASKQGTESPRPSSTAGSAESPESSDSH